jgi:hypothetical protein
MPTVTPPAGSTDTATLDDLTPILDAAVNRLPTADRHAILLRYFENKPVRDVATVLAISEDAAKKRCARAVEKLRHLLTARGLPTTALALAAILPATNTHAAPPAVISAACGLALPGAAAPASISLIAGKTLLMTQLKLTAALVVTLLLATGGLGYAAHVLRDQVPVERHARPPAPAVSLAADAPLAPAAPCREPIEGVIVRADGAPLADVEVYLATPQKRYAFYATRQTNKPQVTDSDGKFSFPRTSPPWVVVARTPDGR